MRKLLSTAVVLLAAGMGLLGNVLAQQTPAAKTQPAPKASAPKAPVKKTATAPAARKSSALTLTTQKEKFSYALGMNLGTGLHRQEVDVNPDLFVQGLKDAQAGGKTLMTTQEAQAVLTEMQNEVRQKLQAKVQALAEENKKEGEAFLAANKTKDGVVTLPSGLQYKIETAGTGPKPSANDTVVCNYRGTLINGTEFDSSYKGGEPAKFPVSGVIKGWTEALQLMPVGSKWQLFVPSELAYGAQGAGRDIGPNSTLIFEVELMAIQPKETGPEKKEPVPENK